MDTSQGWASKTRRASVVENCGPPGRTRTCNLRLRRPLHYPVVLRAVGAQYPIPCRIGQAHPNHDVLRLPMMMGTHCHLMVAQCCLPSLERIPRSAGPITTVAMQRRWPKCVARCHRRCSLPSRCDQRDRAADWPPGWQCHGSGTRGTWPAAAALTCGVPWA